MKKKYFIVLLTGILLFSVSLYAKPNQKCHFQKQKGPIFGNIELLKNELKLTDEQVKKIEEINLKYKKQMLDYKEKLAPKLIQLKKLMLEDEINLNKVKRKLQEISEIKTEIHFLRIKHMVEIEKQLNEDQKRKLRMIKKREFNRMRKGPKPKHPPMEDMY